MKQFWKMHHLPVQDDFIDVESINPAEAFRRQADAINYAAPLYDELEKAEYKLERVNRVEKELRTRILAQHIPVPSASTRTTDLVDAFVLAKSKAFTMPDGTIKDVSESLLLLVRKQSKLELQVHKLQRRLRALEAMADKCDRIMNWAKHEARLEVGRS